MIEKATIFYNAAATTTKMTVAEGNSTEYDSNCYFGAGSQIPSQDENSICANPRFMETLAEGVTACEDLGKLKLQESSPLINAGRAFTEHEGLTIIGNGGKDFYGQEIYQGAPDIGIFEYQGEEGKSTIHGYVKDQYGYKVAGAEVSIVGSDLKGVTDENGYYALTGLDAGVHQIYAAKEQYMDGTISEVQTENKMVVAQELTLGESLSTTGNVSGSVKNAKGGIYNATVSIQSVQTGYQAECLTENDGTFVLEDVPIGQDYRICVSKEGYFETGKDNIIVRPGGITTVELVMTKNISNTTYVLNVDFDDYTAGTFTGDDTWKVIIPDSGKGNVTVVEDAEKEGNKYLQLNKTQSGRVGFYNAESVNLTGIITAEARVKRTVHGKSNHFGMYSYNDDGWKESEPEKSAGPMGTFALAKGKILTHNVTGSSNTVQIGEYSLNEWHIIRNVMNLDTGTFDIYVDDMNTPALVNQPLRTIKSEVDKFLFFESTSNTGDICIDYFRVCQGTPYDYDDASLVGIRSEDVELIQNQGVYEGSVSAETASASLLPIAVSKFAEVSVNGTVITDDRPVEVSLAEGSNEITVVVTAEDGTTVQEYIVRIHRAAIAEQAYLLSLGIDGKTLAPEFSKDIENYSVSVEKNTSVVNLSYTKISDNCSIEIKVNGTAQGTQNEVNLSEGNNQVEIIVGSEDGTNYKTYIIEILRDETTEAES